MATKNTTAPRLEVRGIRKTFGQNAVLKGILNLEKMTNDDIKITGKIESIDIERTEE